MTTTFEPVQKKPGVKMPLLGTLNDFTFPLPGWWRRLPAWLRVTVFLVLVTAWTLHERSAYLGGQYWMDEAITVGISSHPFTAIPGILRMDGSPPLFYMLLHVWMQWFGNSPRATHWLALIFGTLTVPVGYWGGSTLGNKRAGLMTATLFALIAFLDGYSQETRMYSLMTLLGLLATIGFVKGFVYRERGWVILYAVCQALMFYTHDWSIFYCAAGFWALVFLWFSSKNDPALRKNFIKDAVIAYVVAVGLFIPWIPNFIFQSIHTAAPWAPKPHFGAFVQVGTGVIGSVSLFSLMIVVGLLGYWRLFNREMRLSREAKVMYTLLALTVLTLAFAWIASQIDPAWVLRYFAPMIGPLILLIAIGLSQAGILGAVVIVVACVALHNASSFASAYKSNLQDIAAEMGPSLHPGDLVIVGQPEEVPLTYYYLPGGLKFSSTIGPVSDPTYMNWVNALKRYEHSKPAKVVPKLLNKLKVGQQLLFIHPLTEGNSNWDQSWTRLIRRRSAQWGQIIASDKQLVQEKWAPHYYRGACCVADAASLYVKVKK